jgi:hypothetical protein
MTGRAIGTSVLDAVGGIPLFLTAPLYRRWHLRWGATDEEVHAHLPGDEIVTDASFSATRAITIDAPPEQVWPWIVQLGYRRAGFYNLRPARQRRLPQRDHDPAAVPARAGRHLDADGQDGHPDHRLHGQSVRDRQLAAVGEAGQHLGVAADPARRRPAPG